MNCHRRLGAQALAVLVMLVAGGAWGNGQTAPVKSIGKQMPVAGFLSASGLKLSDVPSGVLSTDLDRDGKPDLVVAFAGSGKIVVYLGAGLGKFQAPVTYSAGGHPVALAAIDLNGDGQPDIVTANGADGTVSVLLGAAGGKLAAASVSSVGVEASYLAAGDLNGDGSQDLVIASSAGKALAVLLNDGHGALLHTSIQPLDKVPTGLVLGDFNGDRHVDAAVAAVDGTVEVLFGGGSGTLQLGASLFVSGAKIASLATADFNRDGSLDLAVTQTDGRLLTTFLGKGDGTFGPGTSYTVGNNPIFLAPIDVNADGFADLLTVNQGSNTVSVLVATGDGSFQQARNFTVDDGPVALAAGDFYGTGMVGLVVVDATAKTLNAIAGRGDGSFRAAPSYTGDLSPRAVASGDLNGDGIPDLVVANFCGSAPDCTRGGSLSVYLGLARGGYRLASTQAVGAGPVSVVLADLNGDGNLDAVAANRGDRTLSVLLGVGDGTLRESTTTTLLGSPVALVAGDFNQDGRADLAVISDCGSAKCAQPGSVQEYFGGGDGSFTPGASFAVGYAPSSLAAGDLNGDGVLDLIVANACGKDATCNSAGTATVLLGGVKGAFAVQADIALGRAPSSIALRSARPKGTLDLVVANMADNTVAVLKGSGDGTFGAPTLYAVGNAPHSIVVADLNGDGTSDVAVANTADSTVSVLYGNADGTLVAGDSYAVAAGPEALTAVAAVAGHQASLVTANGNSVSTTPGTEITALWNASPNGTVATTTTITSVSPASPTVNSPVTLTATITPTPNDTDPVVFSSSDLGALTCATPATTSMGVATCTTSQLTAATVTLSAAFADDGTFQASNSGPQSVTVNPAPATLAVALTTPLTVPTVNQSATYTATLSSAAGFTPTAPVGMISFTVNGAPVAACPATTVSASALTAACVFTASAPGTLPVVATYSNDANFTVTTPGMLSQTINKAPTTLAVVLTGPATPTVNQSATFTATLTSAAGFTPTALSQMISFTLTGASSSTCPAVAPTQVSSTTATAVCTVTPSTAGTLNVVANYSGDTNFNDAASTPLAQAIGKAPTAITVVLTSPATPTVNQSATFTATLTSTAGFSPTALSQMISFTLTGASPPTCPAMLPTQTSSTTATATCTVTPPAAGTLTLAASYSGDANFADATSTSLAQTISKAPTALAIVLTSPATPTVNQGVTFTATLTSTAGFTPTALSQMISFTLSGASSSTCAAMAPTQISSTTATAICNVTPSTAGTLNVVANYSGDANFTDASSTPLAQPIGKAPTALAVVLTSPSSTPTVNQSATFTATLTSTAGFTPTALSQTISFALSGASSTACPAVAPTRTSATTATAVCAVTPLAAGTLTVTANYTGDTNFADATSTLPQTISKIPTSLTLSQPGPSAVNTTVTFTATLTAQNSIPTTPTTPGGSISFTVNGDATICPAVLLTAGSVTATCVTGKLVYPSDVVVASYSGDASYTVPANATVTQIVSKVTALTTIVSDITASVVNQPVTYTATVRGPTLAGGQVVPVGSITFRQGSTLLCGGAVTTTSPASPTATASTATCTTTFTSVDQSPYTVTATYSGDTNFNPGVAGTAQAVTVTAQPITAVAVTSSPSPSAVDQAVSFSATLSYAYPAAPTPGTVFPLGTVTFKDVTATPSVTLCSAPVIANGATAACTMTVPLLYRGTHSILASFAASSPAGGTNPNFGNFTSTSVTYPQTVNAASTTVSIVSSLASVAVNAPVTFTATVSKPADATYTGTLLPSGTILFSDGVNPIAGCGAAGMVTVTVSSGIASATCTASFTTATQHVVSALFQPDAAANFLSNTVVPSVTQVVVQAATTLSLSSLQPTSNVNQAVTFNALLAFPSGGGTPTGSVTFTDITTAPGTVLCSNVRLGSGSSPLSASCQVPFGSVGKYAIQAAYTSDGNFTSSTSSFTQTVIATNVSVTLTSTQTTSMVDQPVPFTIALTSNQSGATVPRGTITVKDGTTSTPACTRTLNADGSVAPSCSINFLTPGAHVLVATFASGDNNFNAISSSAVTVNVSPTPTVLTVTPFAGSFLVNQAIPFAAVVAPDPTVLPATVYPATGLSMPTGTVSFFSNGTFVCKTTAIAANGSTSCSALLGTAASYTITATYASGDTNFTSPAATPSVVATVAAGTTAITLTPSQPASIATNTVTFTAVLNSTATVATPPLTTGAVPIAGTFAFKTGTGATVPSTCSTSNIVVGLAYTCAITFSDTSAGTVSPLQPVTVTASFTSTVPGNFTSSSTSATQSIQDFDLAKNATAPAIVYVTQGTSNTNDPFVPSTIAANVTLNAGYSDTIRYACSIPFAGLTCSLTSAAGSLTQTVVITATSAAVPALSTVYTATLTATDPAAPGLVRTLTFPVQVAAIVASSVNLTAGAVGTVQVPFPSGLMVAASSTTNFCPNYIRNGVLTPTTGIFITCSLPSAAVANGVLSVAVKTTAASNAFLVPHSTGRISLAALFGLPLLLLATWRRRTSAFRGNWFRSAGALGLLISLAAITGCGGGFLTTPQSISTSTPAGTYQLEVMVTDASTNKPYYAIIPVVVNQ